MPLATAFETHPLVAWALRIRHNRVRATGLTLSLIVFAVIARLAMGDDFGARFPFAPFYVAILAAALAGGLWPGIAALILGSLAAWYFSTRIPPWALQNSTHMQLFRFAIVSGVNVAIIGFLNAVIDRLHEQHENIRLLLYADGGIVLVGEDGRIELVNATIERLFGYARPELLGQPIELLVPERQATTHRAARGAYMKKPAPRVMGAGRVLTGRRKDGSEFPVEISLRPISRKGERMVLATLIDMSERRRLQQWIVSELQHRTQNLFAVCEAIANRTIDEGATSAEIKRILNARLHTLARSYATLTELSVEGIVLDQIVKQELAAFAERVEIKGCDIVLGPSAAQQFALILHELATNALKYGALSAPQGRIFVEGMRKPQGTEDMFILRWKERGGPLVKPPAQRGFGSMILLDAAKQLGRVTMDYVPEGLSYELEAHVGAIEAPQQTPIH